MYAVIETGGKQYRVEVGTELEVELLDAEPGSALTLDRVLLVADGDEAAIGRPVVDGAAVEAEVVRRELGPKLISFKYRPKARRRVKKGHRQDLTLLRISDIRYGGKSAAETARKAADLARTERQRLEEAAAKQAAADAALAAKLAKARTKEAADEAPAEDGETVPETKPKTTRSRSAKPAAKAAAKPAAKDAAAKPATRKPAAKASATAAEDAAEADADKPAAPKRTRSTKKDE